MTPTPYEAFCLCPGYRHWYSQNDGLRVCQCGHPDREHLDAGGACIGDVVVYPAEVMDVDGAP